MTASEEFAALAHGERERLLNDKLWATEEWVRQRHAAAWSGITAQAVCVNTLTATP